VIDEFDKIEAVVPPDILWGLLAIILLAFITAALMLNHHWKYYGIKDNPKIFAKSLFWIVSFILILIATISLLAYESHLI
jgi:uncharacterized membrane protein